MLLLSGASTTSSVRLGFGWHIWEVPVENMITMGILSNISGFTSVLALAFSKTAFAITLLRLTDGPMKWLVWGIIITLNVAILPSSLVFWIRCNPPAKTWDPSVPGTCWPAEPTLVYSIFAGGKLVTKLTPIPPVTPLICH
jgi:hypothetical protein